MDISVSTKLHDELQWLNNISFWVSFWISILCFTCSSQSDFEKNPVWFPLVHTEWSAYLTTCCKITTLRSNTYPFHCANYLGHSNLYVVLHVYKIISTYAISTILRQSRKVSLKTTGFTLSKLFLTVQKQMWGKGQLPLMCNPKYPPITAVSSQMPNLFILTKLSYNTVTYKLIMLYSNVIFLQKLKKII